MEDATRDAPDSLGRMTTAELRRYRAELERALNDTTIRNAPVAANLRKNLQAVKDQEAERAAMEETSRTEAADRRQYGSLARIGHR